MNNLSSCLLVCLLCNSKYFSKLQQQHAAVAEERANTICSQRHSKQKFIHLQHRLRIEKTSAGGSDCFSIWSRIFHTILSCDLAINY